MNYTEKYHLPQWVKEDRIMMEDFNQMCADMEAGLNANAQAAAGALAAASSKPTSAAVSQAQSTANQALSAANAAQATANAAYSPSQKPYVIGNYTGNGDTLAVTLGFKPAFLIVARQMILSYSNTVTYSTGFAIAGNGVNGSGLTIQNNGFTVSNLYFEKTYSAPHINTNGEKYVYIAFF